MLNTFQVECFLALSRSLNFTQTSEDLFVSQPTLSRNIASLEQELGVQLLVRNTKSVELTAAGRRFARHIAASMDAFQDAVEDARLARDEIVGSLRLGIQADTFEPFVVDLVTRFRKEHPQIELRLYPMSVSKLQRGINNGTLDLVVGAKETNLRNPGQLLLSERSECVALPAGHPLADRESLHMEELRDETFVAMSPTASASGHYLLLKYANDAGFSPRIIASADSVPSLMMMVACSIGISILYQDLSVNAHGRIRFVPLDGVPTFKRFLSWDQDSTNPALAAFLKCAEVFLADERNLRHPL